MSNDEIQALLSATTPAAKAPELEEATAAPIVSAAEIQAMLGIKDPAQEIEPNAVAVTAEPELSVITNEAPIQQDSEESEPDLTMVSNPVDIDFDSIDPSAIEKVPGVLAAAGLAVPVCILDSQMHCMAVEPFDQEAIAEISKACGMTVIPHAALIDKVLATIRTRYGSDDDAHVWECRVEKKSSLLSKLLRRSA